ncbi:TraR/DksA family transcriptional regulator [Nitrosococcus watsonii]|uniref:Transcriptional regulator, TraR/DksA family n=1 Tax=Nitrosococcus watsoni (strain C-113) TaxID=105559 RepID=D8K6E0_NITWC|nr:TraR/DksA family transcriptional regulator [Nitrosococcus watsonii]ADJ28467.1 transcriptional regulator, TraR/DksA family [Nitrosococcus watsonii C-113]
MKRELSGQQRRELKQKLQQQFNELSEKIRQELRESDNQSYIELAGKVHDQEEASLADLLVDINLAIVDLHIEEIREIEQALMRFPKGSYGICTDCGVDIDYQRLQINPAVKRCFDCQARYERTYQEKAHPTL